MRPKILLTGKNGQVGFELQRALMPLGEVVAFDHAECDLAHAQSLRDVVSRIQPQIIINAAAYTAVDKAETDQAAAFAVNGAAPGVLGEEAKKLGALVLHYSTDYVFDGSKSAAYNENDLPNPQGVYGKSKWQGEQALQASGAHTIILRTSWVFGAHGGNFAKTMLRLAADRENLNVVADQFGAPTSAVLIADVSAQLIGQYQNRTASAFDFGLYHLAAGGETHWCDYAKAVVATAHAAGKPLKLKPEGIRAISTAEYPLPAPRPANSRLDTRKLQSTFDLTLPHWRHGLEQVLQRIL